MGPLGAQEMLAIFVLALLLFGPKKLPELGRMLGKALSEFRRAKNELKSTFESHLSELEREVQVDQYSSSSTADSSAHFPYAYDESGRQESDDNSAATAHESDESHNAYVSQSSGANSDETQDTGLREDASNHDLPIAGTVPRSNGHLPAGSPSLAAEEKQSA
jgi:sec-independent protein translocase protein TatA